MEDALSSLEDAAKRNFSVHYIHRLAKMLILQNNEAKEAVNNKLRDLGLGEVDLDNDNRCDDQSHTEGTCVELSPGVGQSTDLISLVGCNPIRLVKDEEELQVRIKSLTPSQKEAFKLMTNTLQQRLLLVTGPGGTGKSFLIHTVVGHLTLCQGKFIEVLASSDSAAYLLGGKTIHRFFRLGVNLECFLEWGTIDCSMVSNADVLIIDECSMMPASLLETVHKLCCFATKDSEKNKLLFAGKSVSVWRSVSTSCR